MLGAFFLLPFLWMLSTALKSDQQVLASPPIWIPSPIVWSNFAKAVDYIPFFRYMGNTFFVAFMDVLGTVLICPLVAYGLSRLERVVKERMAIQDAMALEVCGGKSG